MMRIIVHVTQTVLRHNIRRERTFVSQVLRGDPVQTWSAAERLEASLVRLGHHKTPGERI